MTDAVYIQDEGNQIIVVQGNDYTVCNIVESDIEIEKISFLQLNDTPTSYEGEEGKTVRVNDDGTGLIFDKSYTTFISLTDTPKSYENNALKLVAVNQQGTALQFINYTVGDVAIEYFTQLADVPSSFTNQAGKLLTVSNNEDSLEFKGIDDVLPSQAGVTVGSYNYPQITVDAKGRITYIQEGPGIDLPNFTANEFLIGDGTNIPVTFSNGLANQYLTTASGIPSWGYISKLYSDNGNVLLNIHEAAADNTSTLNITNTNSFIEFAPSNSTQNLIFGPHGEFVVTESGTVFTKTLQLSQNVNLETVNGLKISPGSETVGVMGISSSVYSDRIGDNDFITKYWYDIQPIKTPEGSMVTTGTQEISNSVVSFSIPKGAILKAISLIVGSPFNTRAGIRIYDSTSATLFNSEDSPMLDETTEITLNIKVNSDNYMISAVIDNYEFGYADAYVSYFTAIS